MNFTRQHVFAAVALFATIYEAFGFGYAFHVSTIDPVATIFVASLVLLGLIGSIFLIKQRKPHWIFWLMALLTTYLLFLYLTVLSATVTPVFGFFPGILLFLGMFLSVTFLPFIFWTKSRIFSLIILLTLFFAAYVSYVTTLKDNYCTEYVSKIASFSGSDPLETIKYQKATTECRKSFSAIKATKVNLGIKSF